MKTWLRTIDIVIIKYQLIMPLRTTTPNLWQLVSAMGLRCAAEGAEGAPSALARGSRSSWLSNSHHDLAAFMCCS